MNRLLLLMCSLLFGVVFGGPVGASDEIVFPTLGTHVSGRAVLLAIDDHVFPLRDNLCYYMSKPQVRQEAVLRPQRDDPNAPDELAAHFYGTVLQDQDKFRMWYYGAHRKGGKWKIGCQACYAESDDGIHWIKPILSQVDLNGSKQNNALALVEVDTQGVAVIKDVEETDPARRYKMVIQYMPGDYPTLKTATSADGIHWSGSEDLPARQFREISSFFKHNGKYVVCGHTPSTGEGGQSRGRQGFAWVSPDFRLWPLAEAKSFWLPEPPEEKGYKWKWDQPFDQVHLGVGAASFGNVAVGLYGLWRQRGWGEGGTRCDFGLVISNDGVHFREPIPGHVYLRSDDATLPTTPGKNFPTISCQANGILNVGNETRIYYGRWRNSEWPLEGDGGNYYADIGLATLPRDRWGALGLSPKQSEGSVWSAPITLPKSDYAIALNADGVRGMTVELANEEFQLLPEYSAENRGVSTDNDGTLCSVAWPKAELSKLAGKTIRLKIQLTLGDYPQPRLFSCYLLTTNATK